MDVRDAVEADAEDLADIADTPADVMRNLVHDRSVRIAVEETASNPPQTQDDVEETDDESGANPEQVAESILGFVSFDARPDVVHVTQIDGTPAACTRLLEEPLGFARRERMPVELLVPADSDGVRDAVDEAGFDELGSGPQFDGQPTVRYRLDP